MAICRHTNSEDKNTMSSIDKEWRDKTYAYAEAINRFVQKGLRDGWDNAGEAPHDADLEKLASKAIDAVRQANLSGNIKNLRDVWPPAHGPFIPILEKQGQSIPVVCLLDDGSILARIGAPYVKGYVVRINNTRVTTIADVEFFGVCPNHAYFAVAMEQGVSITRGWMGAQVCFCPWPIGNEDLPDGSYVPARMKPPVPEKLIPFPEGNRVLLVSGEGIYVLWPEKCVRLLPTVTALAEHFSWLQCEYPEDTLSVSLDMAHGAISPDGKWIAVGSQDSLHLVYDRELKLVAEVGNQSEYPHYAIFSRDSQLIAFNSCHFYNGITIGVATKYLPGLTTESYSHDSRTPILDDGARVYAGVHRDDEFIIGDAHGYLRAFSRDGKQTWQHFIGSSIGDIDISADGKCLVATTCAGFLSIIDLDVGRHEPYQIGNGSHVEFRRWIFWKNEARPLMW